MRILIAFAVLLGGCSALPQADVKTQDELLPKNWTAQVGSAQTVEELAQRHLELSLAMNPPLGVQLGIHGRGLSPFLFDRSLPDVSPSAVQNAYTRLGLLEGRLAAMNPASLSPAERVDRRILLNRVRLDMLELADLGQARDPLGYVGLLGNAYSGLLLRDYAPLERRLSSLAARCRATPRFLQQARANLAPAAVRPSAVQKQLVAPRLQGLTREGGLLRGVVPELANEAELSIARRAQLISDCERAATAAEDFAQWFQTTVAPRPDGPWRLGARLYKRKYELYMDYPLSPDQLLAQAEQALQARHAELVALSRQVHDRYLATAIDSGDRKPQARLEDAHVVRNVLDRLAEDRPTPASLIDDSYALADAIVGFVEDRNLLDLPPTAKLRIEPIPPHLSGYAVAMIQTAPPFEPELDSVWFWDLPLLEASEGFLKEYNRPTLASVYIHEGVPGHFVQLEYANQAERLVPRVYRNGPMVEGWASYIETQLVDLGFTVYPEHPLGQELQKISSLKLVLRSIINAIIDIRLHTSDWPEEAALELMTEKGFQQPAEAQGKLTRAKLSSVQLASYFAGEYAIRQILSEYREREGDDFSWKQFNEALLGAGSPPMEVLRERMLGESAQQP